MLSASLIRENHISSVLILSSKSERAGYLSIIAFVSCVILLLTLSIIKLSKKVGCFSAHKITEKPPTGQEVFINTQVARTAAKVNLRSVRESERRKNNLAKSYPPPDGEVPVPLFRTVFVGFLCLKS